MNRFAIHAAAAAMMFCAGLAHAQKPTGLPGNYPNKVIHVVVSSSPGGAIDIAGRAFATKLNERWGNVVLDNRPGIGVAYELVMKSPADGYTLLVTSISAYSSAEIVQKVPYNIRTKFPPIIQLTGSPYIVTVSNDLPVKNVSELIAYAKANPNKLNFGYTNVGSASQLFGELLIHDFGVDMQGIPFKGTGPAYVEQMAGRIHILLGSSSSAGPLVKGGKIRGIATTGLVRTKDQPDLPTIRESQPGFDTFAGWVGLFGVEGMSPALINALNKEGNIILGLPDVEKMLTADGEIGGGTPEQFRKIIADSLDSTARIINQAGIKME